MLNAQLIAFLGVLILAFLTFLIVKNIVVKIIWKIAKKTKTKWDDAIMERNVLQKIAYIFPFLIFHYFSYLFGNFQNLIQKISLIFIVWFVLLTVNSFLNAINDIFKTHRISKKHPIKGYLQIISIIFFLFGSIIIIAILTNKSPLILLSGLGAMTAIILLIFKDTILSLIASLQISFNDLIQNGDWLEVPEFNADGEVIDIALHSVKIQNWDKTISTIPTHKLIDGSFKNWSGMQKSGGRRIKRAIHIDISSIKFCDENMLENFSEMQLITDYIKTKKEEINKFNKENNFDNKLTSNGRKLTNIGTLRAYIYAYLKNHPKIKNEMTFLIRQLPPAPTGLPIEIYVFANDTVWANYEAIQSDIFDHILAIVPEFDLRIFQNPTGNDFRKLN
ncbi:MAG: mechanosensitive ion channel [Candidatus Cloacimonetes bacterium]|nr:mechanosensitive ion channel [Candidatus Cloacimonadota bacterium]MBT6994309.1 mechanosensitive ion channel [Candidatus Cloacimonadota bacterium]MBT7468937.1 mechanosensitive ion channel [Candidatus Cloacimonadota bacterium]